jgi:hypothetical protein
MGIGLICGRDEFALVLTACPLAPADTPPLSGVERARAVDEHGAVNIRVTPALKSAVGTAALHGVQGRMQS